MCNLFNRASGWECRVESRLQGAGVCHVFFLGVHCCTVRALFFVLFMSFCVLLYAFTCMYIGCLRLVHQFHSLLPLSRARGGARDGGKKNNIFITTTWVAWTAVFHGPHRGWRLYSPPCFSRFKAGTHTTPAARPDQSRRGSHSLFIFASECGRLFPPPHRRENSSAERGRHSSIDNTSRSRTPHT